MWMATLDNGLVAALYGPSTVHTTVGERMPVKITSETNYPFDEKIRLIVEPDKSVNFPLYLRIPGWCKSPSVTLNKQNMSVQDNENGFMVIKRKWTKGDVVEIYFPMEVKVVSGHETSYPQLKYFLEGNNRKLAKLTDINNPFQSIYYGPLLFALPLKDIDANTQAPGQQWNFALNLKDDNLKETVKVIREPMPKNWKWQLESPVKLMVNASEFDWHPTEIQPLPKENVKTGKETKFLLVPYGCTKFRVSMFPVSK